MNNNDISEQKKRALNLTLAIEPELLFKLEGYSREEKLQWLEEHPDKAKHTLATRDGRVRLRQDIIAKNGFDNVVLKRAQEIIAEQIYQDSINSLDVEKGEVDIKMAVFLLDQAIIVAYPKILEYLNLKRPDFTQRALEQTMELSKMDVTLGQRIFLKMIEYNNTYKDDPVGDGLIKFTHAHKKIITKTAHRIINHVKFEISLIDYLFQTNAFPVFRYFDYNDLSENQKKMALVSAFENLGSLYGVKDWSFNIFDVAPIKGIIEMYEKYPSIDDEDKTQIKIIIERRKLNENLTNEANNNNPNSQKIQHKV